jgi:acyl-coenzyme A thioesterase PaaI-like protein
MLSGDGRAAERKRRKMQRQVRLRELIDANPFITDDELADKLEVSIQTIRLDRLNLSIPEVRLRTKELAEDSRLKLRSLTEGDVIGDLTHLELGSSGMSVLETTKEMAFANNGIVRGHYIFAQANSLAVAMVDAERALTGAARVRYRRPVMVGQRMVAKAKVTYKTPTGRYRVKVTTEVAGEEVFVGKFVVVAQS